MPLSELTQQVNEVLARIRRHLHEHDRTIQEGIRDSETKDDNHHRGSTGVEEQAGHLHTRQNEP